MAPPDRSDDSDQERGGPLNEDEGPKVVPVIDGWWCLPPEEREALLKFMEAEKQKRDRDKAK
jgi:hypothetical protein